jgi:hypothetical protein
MAIIGSNKERSGRTKKRLKGLAAVSTSLRPALIQIIRIIKAYGL